MKNDNQKGFTIVELLVVIVVIGILAAITITSFNGVRDRAMASSLQSDLNNNAQQLKLYHVENDVYPSSINSTTKCPATPVADTKYCLKTSSGATLIYIGENQTFTIIATKNNITYSISESSAPESGPGPNWVVIGGQIWSKTNLNTGTMINGASLPTDNSIVEKYCYNNLESNCTTYGGLYLWNEMMQYSTTEEAKGICPDGTHIPSDNEIMTLEKSLGMSEDQAIIDNAWRGSTEGTKLKALGSSGLDIPIAGFRGSTGAFSSINTIAFIWSSTQSDTSAYDRGLDTSHDTVYRNAYTKDDSFSVRCLVN